MENHRSRATKIQSYASVNGLKMYYEIEGVGAPLVYIPPAFGFAGLKPFPSLAERYLLVSPDLQGHGRTADIADRQLSIEQYAEDVIGLLNHLEIETADFFGQSYGGSTAALIAARYPNRARRVVTYAATFGPPSSSHNQKMLYFDHPPTADSRNIQFQRESYQAIAPKPDDWKTLYEKVGAIQWLGFSHEELASIEAPFLIIVGDHDFVLVEHALETFKQISRAELAVVPSASHFALYSEPERILPLVQYFLDKADIELPLATAAVGYHPGETR